MDEREQYRAILEDNLEYDILLENNPYDRDTIAEIMELLLDTICSKRQYIRIAGDDKPREVVKSQFLKLNCTHIEYVLSSFKENASKVRNIKQYLLASLYNAPLTISNYYDALVRHEMLAMGRAIMSAPKLIVMDEPSMGLSPVLVQEVFSIIETMHELGITILLVEQNAKMALAIADRAYVLENGRITMSGGAHDLLHDDKVRKAYLGA